MEKPFGTDLESAIILNDTVHETFHESQIFRIDHFLGKEAAQNILAFRFANGLFEPIWKRDFIDHVQIDIPETLGLDRRASFYEQTGAFKDMVVTHLLQVLAFVAMEPPTALEPRAISEEKNKVFRSLMPIMPTDVVRGQYAGYTSEEGVARDSDTETFIALKCGIDNWRWAGVPFYLRTGKRMAEGQRIISIAFKEAPKSMFPSDSGVGKQGPDHLTFDLSEDSKVSLSFYGKRPGPGMKMDKLSMQFATQEGEHYGDVLEAYERLILDTMRGDHTLFNTADGIESLWERSQPLLDDPPPVKPYPAGQLGAQRDPPAHRAARVAAALRAGLAQQALTGMRRARHPLGASRRNPGRRPAVWRAAEEGWHEREPPDRRGPNARALAGCAALVGRRTPAAGRGGTAQRSEVRGRSGATRVVVLLTTPALTGGCQAAGRRMLTTSPAPGQQGLRSSWAMWTGPGDPLAGARSGAAAHHVRWTLRPGFRRLPGQPRRLRLLTW